MKRFILSLLFCLLVFSPALAVRFTVDGIEYNTLTSSTCEVVNNTFYKGSITIPSSVTNSRTTYRVIRIADNAFRENPDLTDITLPNSITSIGDNAFYACYGLTDITLPNSITSIGNYAFYLCM